jgi:hypothetical protein
MNIDSRDLEPARPSDGGKPVFRRLPRFSVTEIRGVMEGWENDCQSVTPLILTRGRFFSPVAGGRWPIPTMFDGLSRSARSWIDLHKNGHLRKISPRGPGPQMDRAAGRGTISTLSDGGPQRDEEKLSWPDGTERVS